MRRAGALNFITLPVFKPFNGSFRFNTGQNTLFVEGTPGNYRLSIPLPKSGKQLFTLTEKSNIKTFMNKLTTEDPTIKKVGIYDTNENKLAGNLSSDDLLGANWKLQIDDKVYNVQSPFKAEIGKYSFVVDSDIANSPHFSTLRKFLDDQTGNELSFNDFLAKCNELGINEGEGRRFLRAFTKLGTVVHYEGHLELHDRIFLSPAQISKNLEKELNWPIISLPTEEKMKLLIKWEAELSELEAKKDELFAVADRRVQILKWSIFLGLCAQFVLFARFTWWDFDWGVMEPVSWFTTVVETSFTAYLYYLYTKSEYSHMDMRHALIAWKTNRLITKNKFPMDKYVSLKKSVSDLRLDIYGKDH